MNDHRERLQEFGVPADAVEALIDERLGAIGAATGHLQQVVARYGEQNIQAASQAISELAKSDASYQAIQRVDPVAALEYGMLRVGAAGPLSQAQAGPSRESAGPTPFYGLPHSMRRGGVPIHSTDWSRDEQMAYIKARMAQSVTIPD